MDDKFKDRNLKDSHLSGEEEDDLAKVGATSRARNRTVLITPDVTGQVRAMLGGDEGPTSRDPLSELLTPGSWDEPKDKGFQRPNQLDDANAKRGTGKMKQQSPSPEPAAQPAVSVNARAVARPQKPKADSKIHGFMVTFDSNPHGEVFELREGRKLITSRPTDQGDFILIEDESVSPMHAVLRVTKEGDVQVMDQLSEHGTGVTPAGGVDEQEVSSRTSVGHGDCLRFGHRKFVICMVPRVAE